MAFVTDLPAFFSQVYAAVAAARAALSLPALVPSSLPNFQIGGEFAPEAQVAPRIIIVPTGVESYDFSQQMPTNQDARSIGRVPSKSVFRRWLTFDVQIWGDPDLTPRDVTNPANTTPPAVPDPAYGFNSTIELEREFLVAITSLIGSAGQAWQPIRAEFTTANVANNRYGRLLVLSFKLATPVTREPWTMLPYSQVQGDGGVAGEITVQAEALGSDTPETVATFEAPPPEP
jgi:hypothetical protein